MFQDRNVVALTAGDPSGAAGPSDLAPPIQDALRVTSTHYRTLRCIIDGIGVGVGVGALQ